MASDLQRFEAFFCDATGGPGCGGYLSSMVVILQGLLMILMSAILRFWIPREPAANDLLAEARLRLGHVGLTVITLVYILVTFWQR